jgi:hypothetical protein
VWGGGRVMPIDNKEEIISQLNTLIYDGDGDFTLSDIEDIIGDGDLFEYI